MAEYNRRRAWYPQPYTHYASIELTVSGGAIDYSMAAHTTLFNTLHTGNDILIRVSGAAVTIKLNSIFNDTIALSSGDSIGFQNLAVSNIYVTTASGAAPGLKISMCGWA
jgi:hypothetical protein